MTETRGEGESARQDQPEAWLPVLGFEGLYSVSNRGVIMNRKGENLSDQSLAGSGYVKVSLHKNGERTQTYLHRVVVEAFLGEIPDGLEVNHKNGDKLDNRLDNLEVVTRQQNEQHSRQVLGNLCKPVIATRVADGETRQFYSIDEAARQLEMPPVLIWRCLNGRREFQRGWAFTYAAPQPPAVDGDVAWMIECGNGFTGWWTGKEPPDCRFFDKDPNNGVRFATKEEAEQVIKTRGNSCMIATEHKWLDGPKTQPPAWKSDDKVPPPKWYDLLLAIRKQWMTTDGYFKTMWAGPIREGIDAILENWPAADAIPREIHERLVSEDVDPFADKYHELLMAVASKYPGESRHETALRYIRKAEECKTGGSDKMDERGGK